MTRQSSEFIQFRFERERGSYTVFGEPSHVFLCLLCVGVLCQSESMLLSKMYSVMQMTTTSILGAQIFVQTL